MHITADYNLDSYDYYLSPVFVSFPELEKTLRTDFLKYKPTGELPHYFGRDTTYDDLLTSKALVSGIYTLP